MLKHLEISNFAIIDHIELDFHDGLTVLTGETGAGKSILIDAISLILGDRASQDMIRSETQSARIEAVFTHSSERIRAKLTKLGISTLDDTIVIFREISQQNKNTVKINGVTINLQDLKEISKDLADVHSQFDTQRLINPQNYIQLIDGFNRLKTEAFLNEYQEALFEYRHALGEYNSLLKQKTDAQGKLEMQIFTLKELKNGQLVSGEKETLIEEERVLDNFDKVYSSLQEITAISEEKDFQNDFYRIVDLLSRLTTFGKDFSDLHERIDSAYYETDDILHSLSEKLDSLNFDPSELERIQERVHFLEELEHKYRMTIPELIQYQADLEKEIDRTVNYDHYLNEAKAAVEGCFDSVLRKGRALSALRTQISAKITEEIKSVLKDLSLPNTAFQIVVEPNVPTNPFMDNAFQTDGFDSIELMISTNVGEPMKALSKTASGGEMSRVMLAFKTVFIRAQNLSTIIFDEIDTGISGFVAKQIAKKIREISTYCQVVSITHIPQVVAFGDHHLLVSKEIVGKRTVAKATYLEYDERVVDIAKMISGDKPSEASLQSAKELLLGN